MALLFENVTCTRCGGSGRMPFSVWGGLCFKCGGKGATLTKRGWAAQHWYNEQRSKPVTEFQIGDLILFEGFSAGSYSQPSKWGRVTAIRHGVGSDFCYPDNSDPCVEIITTYGTLVAFTSNPARYRFGLTAEEKAELKRRALEYQATLTKGGTVRKLKQAA